MSRLRYLLPRVLAAGLLLLAVLTLYKGLRLAPHVRSLVVETRTLRALAGSGPAILRNAETMSQVRESVATVGDDLAAIRAELRPLLRCAQHLGGLPVVGGDVAAAPALLDAAVALCAAGRWGLLGLEPVMGAVAQAGGGPAVEAALPALVAAEPDFSEAESAVREARLAMARVDVARLSPQVVPWVARLDRYLPLLESAAALAQRAPVLLGEERPVTYLVLAQNGHELRPTGGFISGVGVVQIAHGRVITSTFEDSYRVDAGCELAAHPPAPAPLREYIWAPALMFRDANWSPDFPASASVATSIYRLCRDTEVDGVIAVDLESVGSLLAALGPLQPEGYPEPITGDTFLDYVSKYWTDPLRSETITVDKGDWWTHRKDFMGDLLQAALARATDAPERIDMARLGSALLASLQGRHLLLSLNDEAAAEAVALAGWDGALRPAEGDYFTVVDANVGFRKVNPAIRQSIAYHVEAPAQGEPLATLTIRYENASEGRAECVAGSHYDESYEEMMQGCYWDYLRVYVPLGSRLLGAWGGDTEAGTSEEAGKTVFATLMVLPPGESREITFQYRLPASVTAGEPDRYQLLIQKQAGAAAVPVQLSLGGRAWHLVSRAGTGDGHGSAEISLATDVQLAWVAADGPAYRAWAALAVGGALLGALVAARLRPRGGQLPEAERKG